MEPMEPPLDCHWWGRGVVGVRRGGVGWGGVGVRRGGVGVGWGGEVVHQGGQHGAAGPVLHWSSTFFLI